MVSPTLYECAVCYSACAIARRADDVIQQARSCSGMKCFDSDLRLDPDVVFVQNVHRQRLPFCVSTASRNFALHATLGFMHSAL
jgi:hypothetical protein